MFFDSALILAGAISTTGTITAQAMNGAGNILGTNTIDLSPPALNFPAGGGQIGDIGAGERLGIAIYIATAPTVGTSCQFQLIQADDAGLTTNVQILTETDAVPIASLPAGAIVQMNVDPAAPYVPKRYIGLRVVNVGAIATLSVFAAIVKDLQSPSSRFLTKNGFGLL